SGEPGIGKTTLLREVQRRSSKRHWRTALSNGKVDLRVEPDTTMDIFSRRVRELLNILEAMEYKDGGPGNPIRIRLRKIQSSVCGPCHWEMFLTERVWTILTLRCRSLPLRIQGKPFPNVSLTSRRSRQCRLASLVH